MKCHEGTVSSFHTQGGRVKYFPQYYRKSLPGIEVCYSWPAQPVLPMVEVGWLSHPPHHYHFLQVIKDELVSYTIVCVMSRRCMGEWTINYHWVLMQCLGRMYILAEMAIQVFWGVCLLSPTQLHTHLCWWVHIVQKWADRLHHGCHTTRIGTNTRMAGQQLDTLG